MISGWELGSAGTSGTYPSNRPVHIRENNIPIDTLFKNARSVSIRISPVSDVNPIILLSKSPDRAALRGNAKNFRQRTPEMT
jgi:hypothetical protein